jgi:hypothetical protein
MTRLIFGGFCVLLVVAGLSGLLLYGMQKSQEGTMITYAPWDVVVRPDGSLEVMNLVVGGGTAAEAAAALDKEPRLLLYVGPGGDNSLEASFGKVTVGGFSGTLIANLASDDAWAEKAKERAPQQQTVPGDLVQYTLSDEDVRTAQSARVVALTFIPVIEMADDIIKARFGQPEKVVQPKPRVFIWFYRSKGIFLTQSLPGQEVIQYVPIGDYDRITAPMQNHPVVEK